MTHVTLNSAARTVDVIWPTGTTAAYPYIWLRDNCPSNFHPQTFERVVDLMQVDVGAAPTTAELKGDDLSVVWPDGHLSTFSLDWLARHRPGHPAFDPADVEALLWRGDLKKADLPSSEAGDVLAHDDALRVWMEAVKRTGIGLITRIEDADGGMDVAKRIGFQRETNFGTTFEVVSKPNPNNLAYTSVALPLHTDLTNQETPPGFQFLHCLANNADGGGSLFCDGFAIADHMRISHPDAYRLLADTYIPMRFHDDDYDIRQNERVIIEDHLGRVVEIRFNAHLAGVFDMSPDLVAPYYEAYRIYMMASRSDEFVTSFRLTAGEMIVFDNRRILHGRAAFDPNTGNRHLRGCYVDRGEWDSRMRMLACDAEEASTS